MKSLAVAITEQEAKDLARLETQIKLGIKSFEIVIKSMLEIKDRKLYRAQYGTWEEYCRLKWNMSFQRFKQLSDAAEIKQELGDDAEGLSESALRALKSVPKAKRKGVAAKAKKAGKPTAEAIKQAAAQEIDMDNEGYPIPENVRVFWARSDEVKAILSTISKIVCTLRDAQKEKDPMYGEVMFSNTIADLEKAYHSIKCALPHAVCTTCQGHPETQPNNGCRMCHGRGLISKFAWDNLAPETIKRIRNNSAKK